MKLAVARHVKRRDLTECHASFKLPDKAAENTDLSTCRDPFDVPFLQLAIAGGRSVPDDGG